MRKIFTLIALLAFASSAYARDTISIVGSSTVFPYATIGAERFSEEGYNGCLLYTSPSPRDTMSSRMPSSA